MSDPIKEADLAAASAGDPEVLYWRKELDLSLKREKKWRKDAEEVIEIYEGDRSTETSFNILYSNTETLLPACYAQLPRPIVERRYKDADPLAKASSTALERALSYLMDSADAEYDPFDSLMEQAVLGALVPGRGLTRFRYEPKFEDSQDSMGDSEENEGGGGESDGEGAGEETPEDIFPKAEPGERVVYETICGEDVEHDQVLMGYARRWVDVPWLAYSHEMNKMQLEENFGKALAEKIPLAMPGKRDAEGWKKAPDMEEGENRGSLPVCCVYEIWDKRKKEVVFVAEGYNEGVLKRVPDPYKLSGFFNCPEPLQFLLKRSSLIPTPIFKLYEQQARELNRLSMRINRILNAMKVRGFYDGTLQDLKALLNSDDNTLIGVKNVAALQDGKNLQNSIWLMPLNELVTVLQQLLMGREACKQTIYEITGIADIMRGSTQASETATAQNIKNQWGTLRVKRIQRYTQKYVRECLRIVGEMSGKFFSIETFAGMTNLPYATPQEVQQAQQAKMMLQQLMSRMPPPTPGQQPFVPPQVQQMAAMVQQVEAKPKWTDVVGLLRADVQRFYKIDIETNSTLDLTTQEDKQNIVDAMTALANTMQSFLPAVQSGAMTMPALKETMLSISRRFNFGRQLEDAIAGMPDQLTGADPQMVAKQAEDVAKREQDLQQKEQDLKAREAELAMKVKMAEMELKFQQEMASKELEYQQKLAEMNSGLAERELAMAEKEAVMTIKEVSMKGAEADMNRKHEMRKEMMTAEDRQSKAQTTPAAKKEGGGDQVALVVRELLDHISRPARAVRDKATGAIVIQR